MAVLTAISPTTLAATHGPRSATARRSMLMPTEMKNSPISSPLNGSMSTWIWWRNSVSASSIPARNAPSAGLMPADAVPADAAIAVSSVTATKNSGARDAAASRNSGRSTRRPSAQIPAAAASAVATPMASDAASEPPTVPASAGTRISSGTTARSWNSSTEKVARPARVGNSPRCTSSAMTTAVDDSAKLAPMSTDAAGELPHAYAIAPITSAVTDTCVAPRPSTSRRMLHRRSNDISRPITKSRNTIPNSATVRTLAASS